MDHIKSTSYNLFIVFILLLSVYGCKKDNTCGTSISGNLETEVINHTNRNQDVNSIDGPLGTLGPYESRVYPGKYLSLTISTVPYMNDSECDRIIYNIH